MREIIILILSCIPADDGPATVVQGEGLLEGVLELDVLEILVLVLLLRGEDNLGAAVGPDPGLHLLLLLRRLAVGF